MLRSHPITDMFVLIVVSFGSKPVVLNPYQCSSCLFYFKNDRFILSVSRTQNMAGNGNCVPEVVKKQMRSVLMSSENGVKLSNFVRDYSDLVHEPLPFKKYGFPNLVSMMLSVQDVCRLKLFSFHSQTVVTD